MSGVPPPSTPIATRDDSLIFPDGGTHVDEARRDHQPVDVHDFGRIQPRRRRITDEADPFSHHPDVLPFRWPARAVVDDTADQQQVRRRLGAQVADPQRGHRRGGQERPGAPAKCHRRS